MVGEGRGGVYAAVAGPAVIPEAPSWTEKQPGQPLEEILTPLAETTPVWRRQLVLGPALELCIGSGGPTRRRVA